MVCHNRPLAKQSSASNSGRGGLRFHIIGKDTISKDEELPLYRTPCAYMA
jgi:hypothetical protein